MSKKEPRSHNPLAVYKYAGMAMKMAIVIGVFVWAGRHLDERTHSDTPVYTLILSLAGVAVAIYIVIRDTSESK